MYAYLYKPLKLSVITDKNGVYIYGKKFKTIENFRDY